MIISIILAGGKSTRFGKKNKLFHYINNEKVIVKSVNSLYNISNLIIIVCNSKNYKKIYKLCNKKKINFVINDRDNRIDSIKKGYNYINKNLNTSTVDKIIIHDAARPFISENYINKIAKDDFKYSQYYLKLTNGLAKIKNKKTNKYKAVDRSKYIELTTPIAINFELLQNIMNNFEDIVEFLPILNNLKIKYNLIEGRMKYLRKITYLEDIF